MRGFDEQRWAEQRFNLVVTGNLAKFGQHPDLRDFLLGTGSRVLVEAPRSTGSEVLDWPPATSAMLYQLRTLNLLCAAHAGLGGCRCRERGFG